MYFLQSTSLDVGMYLRHVFYTSVLIRWINGIYFIFCLRPCTDVTAKKELVKRDVLLLLRTILINQSNSSQYVYIRVGN